MSLDTKRADPQKLTSVQHKLRQFGAALHPAFCILVLREQKYFWTHFRNNPSPLKFRVASGRLSSTMASENVFICLLDRGKNHIVTLMPPCFGMVFA